MSHRFESKSVRHKSCDPDKKLCVSWSPHQSTGHMNRQRIWRRHYYVNFGVMNAEQVFCLPKNVLLEKLNLA